jgi:hypothetical protein
MDLLIDSSVEPREGEELREDKEGALGDGGSEYEGWVSLVRLFNSSALYDDAVGVLSLSWWLWMWVKSATMGCVNFWGVDNGALSFLSLLERLVTGFSFGSCS